MKHTTWNLLFLLLLLLPVSHRRLFGVNAITINYSAAINILESIFIVTGKYRYYLPITLMHKRINQNDYFLSRPFLTCPVVYCMQYLRVQYRCVQLKTYFESFFKYCLCLLGLLQRLQEGPKLDVVENLIKIQITQFLGDMTSAHTPSWVCLQTEGGGKWHESDTR